METLFEGLAKTWEALAGIVTLFIGLWLVSKPSKWMEARKKRKEAPTETIFLGDKTLRGLGEVDAGAEGRVEGVEGRSDEG